MIPFICQTSEKFLKPYDVMNRTQLCSVCQTERSVFGCSLYIQWMSEYRTGLVFRQLALVPFTGSSDFGHCLKILNWRWFIAINQSELVALGLNDQKFVWNPNSLPFGFRRTYFRFWSFRIQTFTVQICIKLFVID